MKLRHLFILVPALLLFVNPVAAQQDPTATPPEIPKRWVPKPPEGMPSTWDWVQLTSGEWLKGKFIALYSDNVEFDSDELNVLNLDWEDVRRVRTARRMEVRIIGKEPVRGRLYVEDDLVRVMPKGDPLQEFARGSVLTVSVGSPQEIDRWTMKIGLGANVRSGNTDVVEANLQGRFVRRSADNRLTFDYLGNYNVTEGEGISDNHRASANWDRFVNERLFWNPIFAEYFRDPFQNIDHRSTLAIGVGLHVVDTDRVEWDLSGGPGYQTTWFDSVAVGEPEREESPSLLIETNLEVEVTGWVDFVTEYRLQLGSSESGGYNHHLVIAFETELTKRLDFDLRWVWDRTQNPQENADGLVPDQDDYRFNVALSFDF